MNLRSIPLVAIVVATFASQAQAGKAPTVREVREAVADALDEAREADRTCRDEILELVKDASRAAQDLRAKDRKAVGGIEKALERAERRSKAACSKRVIRTIEDALDTVSALADGDGDDSARSEPTMQDVSDATAACGRADRMQGDDKPCLDAILSVMRGSFRPIALKIPASCSSILDRGDFRYCMEWAGKSRRSPIEVNDYCGKNTKYTKERKDCIAEWSAKDAGGTTAAPAPAPAQASKKNVGDACLKNHECASNYCDGVPRHGAVCGRTQPAGPGEIPWGNE